MNANEIAAASELASLPDEPAFMDEQDPEITSGSKTKRPWRIETPDAAEWALRRKAESDDEIASIRGRADFEKRRIDARTERLVAAAGFTSSFFEGVLLEWVSRTRSQFIRGKVKSKKFLYGVIGFRVAPEKLAYDDEDAALAWAKKLGVEAGLFGVTYQLKKAEIKAYAREHGVVPPGARWQGGDDEAYVDAAAPTFPAAVPALEAKKVG